MSSPVVEIVHREEFASAHQLVSPELSDEENRALYGPCATLHGHNYAVEVCVRGPVEGSTGMVMDLNRLGQLVRAELIDRVDHRNLNTDVPFLEGLVPTAENIAVAFWGRLAPRLEGGTWRLHRLRLYESRTNFVDYHGPDR